MQWMVDGIHDFTVTDHQKNLLEELIIIVPWIACALSEFFWKDDGVNLFEVYPKHDF